MSVPNFDEDRAAEGSSGGSPDDVAVSSRAGVAEFGVQPALFSRFSLFPLSRPRDAAGAWRRVNRYGMIRIVPGEDGSDVFPVSSPARPPLSTLGGQAASPSGPVPGKQSKQPVIRALPVPSGGLPRLLMVDIATEARRVAAAGGDPSRLDLTGTLNAYVTERLGVRKGSQNRAVWAQLEALLKASITFTQFRAGDAGGFWERETRLHVADDLCLWVPGQTALDGFEPFIRLSRGFVELVTGEGAVPVRRDILARLAGKPMAMDVLTWLSGITYRLHVSGGEYLDFTWDDLYETFTHDYTTRKKFQERWVSALGEAKEFYPDAVIDPAIRDPRDRRRTLVRVRRSPLLIPTK